MSDNLIFVQLRIGTNAGRSTQKSGLKLSHIESLAKSQFVDFTLISAKGVYQSDTEDSAIVEIFLPLLADDQAAGVKIFALDKSIREFVHATFKELDQNAVHSSITFTIDGQDIRRTQMLTRELLEEDPPILFPSLVERCLCPWVPLPVEGLYRIIGEHSARLFQNNSNLHLLPGYALVCRPSPEANSTKIVLRDWSKKQAWRRWDARILAFDSPLRTPPNEDLRLWRRANFISLFRYMSARQALFVTRLHRLLHSASFPVIPVGTCNYNLGIASTEGLCLETIDAWRRQTEANGGKFREFLVEHRGMNALEGTTYPLLGISVVTKTPDGRVLLKKRSSRVAMSPGAYHVVPSGMAEMMDLDQPSVFATFLRELDEELFRGPEAEDSFASLQQRPHLRKLEGSLTYLGYAVDLLNHHVEVIILFEPQKHWWNKWSGLHMLNWEYAGGSLDQWSLEAATEKALGSPSEFVQVCAAALKLALDRSDPRC